MRDEEEYEERERERTRGVKMTKEGGKEKSQLLAFSKETRRGSIQFFVPCLLLLNFLFLSFPSSLSRQKRDTHHERDFRWIEACFLSPSALTSFMHLLVFVSHTEENSSLILVFLFFLPSRDKEVNRETSQMFLSYLCSQLLHSKVPSSCSHRLRHKKSYLLLASVQQEQHILSHLSSPWLFVCFMMIRKPNEFLSLAKTTGMTGSPSSSNELPSRRRKRRKTKKGTRRRWGLKKVTLGRRVEGPQWLQSLATFSPVSLSLHGLSFLEKRVITCDGEKCVSWRKSRARVDSHCLFSFSMTWTQTHLQSKSGLQYKERGVFSKNFLRADEKDAKHESKEKKKSLQI